MAEYTPARVEHLDHPAVRRFVKVAEKVCDVFERVDDLPEVELLRQLEELLPLAYSLAHRIPDLYDRDDDEDDEDSEEAEDDDESVRWERPPKGLSDAENMARWKDLYERMGQKLGAHSHIAFVLDPASPDERGVVDGELAHLLAALYVNLKDGLILYGRSSGEDRAEGLWALWFGMKHGWGWELAQAFLPIHSLLHQHYDAIGEEWWANYDDEEASP
jgi:hypothetical protein